MLEHRTKKTSPSNGQRREVEKVTVGRSLLKLQSAPLPLNHGAKKKKKKKKNKKKRRRRKSNAVSILC